MQVFLMHAEALVNIKSVRIETRASAYKKSCDLAHPFFSRNNIVGNVHRLYGDINGMFATDIKDGCPRPYIVDDNFQLYFADSISLLKKFPEEAVDMIFADPPYNLSNNGTTCHAGKRVSVNKGEWDASNGMDADFQFHFDWLAACKRVLKPEGTIWISGTYHSIYLCGFALQKQEWHILNDIVWYKPNAAPNLACRMFTASHETLLWARKSKSAKHYFDYKAMKDSKPEGDMFKNVDKQMRSIWAISTPGKAEKSFGKHPTQKPVALLERIIVASCPKRGIVLDPFCGSGTTGVAALKHGREFIGIDSEEVYLKNLAYPRLKEIIEKNSL